MTFARITPLLASLALASCATGAAEPHVAASSASGARYYAAFTPEGASGQAQFAPPRAPDRAADPMSPASAAVRLDLPFAPGPEGPGVALPEEQPGVLAELQFNAGHLQRCWMRRAGAVSGGSIVIHAHISTEGTVEGQCTTEDTVGDPELLRCASDLVAMGRYPRLGDETIDVVFPFHFGDAAAGGGAG